MRLRSEVEYGIDVVFAKHMLHASWRSDVSLLKDKIWLIVQDPRVVKRRAVVKLVERDHMVLWICEDQVSDKPACTICSSENHSILDDTMSVVQ